MATTSSVSLNISACGTLRGNAVEHQRVLAGMKPPDLRAGVNELPPQFDRSAASGTSSPRLEYSRKILPSGLSGRRLRKTSPQAQWKKSGNDAEVPAMRALARTGRAKHENRAVFHRCDR